ncbi:MAG: membrane protein insertase YidC [Eubacteriales bacterium]|nr:membrane protein insertase YidC [Eubacteriales bacterium]
MLRLLYNLLIMPIQLVVEMTYSLMSRFLDNQGLAIIAVSIVIQLLVLPLYKRSDLIQEEEQQKQKSMAHWVSHIKKTFHGDERFMMLNTYYRQQNYKPYYALKSSFSILLQIPFFMAAYNYLSNLQEIKGVSFWFIRDLGAPDHMFCINGFYLNMLPVAMTLINIVSGIIYTKGQPLKSKLQVYGLAVIFLVLLYNSPAGLVLYWTMNNVFSLLKNVFMKLVKLPHTPWRGLVARRLEAASIDRRLFLAEQLLLTILLGAGIPLSVISASATEFIVDGSSPMRLVLYTLSVYAGIFLVWFSIFYYLMTQAGKNFFLF